jgi:hypothetical protein
MVSEPIEVDVKRFVDAAVAFCEFVEGPVGNDLDYIRALITNLSQLYIAAVNLPDLGLPNSEVDEQGTDTEEWKSVCNKFSGFVVQGYWHVFNPLHPDKSDPVFSVLGDDMGDIHQDVKISLKSYERGDLREAVWEWRWSFRNHWGRHLVEAQRALFSYLADAGG